MLFRSPAPKESDKKIPSLMALGELSPPEEMKQRYAPGGARGRGQQQVQWSRGGRGRGFYGEKVQGKEYRKPPGRDEKPRPGEDKPRFGGGEDKPREEKPGVKDEHKPATTAEKQQPPSKEGKAPQRDSTVAEKGGTSPRDQQQQKRREKKDDPRRPPTQKLYDPPHKQKEKVEKPVTVGKEENAAGVGKAPPAAGVTTLTSATIGQQQIPDRKSVV